MSNKQISSSPISIIAYLICALGASFYMYEFSLQVSLGVMTDELMRDLHLNAMSLGLISAAFYYAYMPMQIPAGLLHDGLGPRFVLTLAIAICAMGALCFAFSHTIWQASLARFMMGIGAACSFSGALILIARWFPVRQFALISGLVQLMSSIGAIGGELPLAIAIRHWTWRPTMVYLSIIGLLLTSAVWLIVRNYPKNTLPFFHVTQISSNDKSIPKLNHVLGSMQSWWIAIYSFLVWAPIAAFAGLWGVPFLVSSYHISTESASLACAAIWIGIGLGCPIMGWLSERIQQRCVLLTLCACFGILGSFFAIYFRLSLPLLYISLFFFGCAGSGQSLAFSVVRDRSHPRLIGAAIGLNNMATVAGGAILQPIIGYLLHLHWNGVILNGIPIYNTLDYRMALLMIPLCYLSAAFISIKCIKETHCQQTYPLN